MQHAQGVVLRDVRGPDVDRQARHVSLDAHQLVEGHRFDAGRRRDRLRLVVPCASRTCGDRGRVGSARTGLDGRSSLTGPMLPGPIRATLSGGARAAAARSRIAADSRARVSASSVRTPRSAATRVQPVADGARRDPQGRGPVATTDSPAAEPRLEGPDQLRATAAGRLQGSQPSVDTQRREHRIGDERPLQRHIRDRGRPVREARRRGTTRSASMASAYAPPGRRGARVPRRHRPPRRARRQRRVMTSPNGPAVSPW